MLSPLAVTPGLGEGLQDRLWTQPPLHPAS